MSESFENGEKLDKISTNISICSPYSNRPFSLERVVGGMSYQNGNISSATAFKASYAIESRLELDKSSGEEVQI